MKVGIIQMSIAENKQENLGKAAALVKKAKQLGADIAVLPEMFNCPMQHRFYREFAELKGEESYLALSKMARENEIYLVGGSVPELAEAKADFDDADSREIKIYNTSWSFDPTGSEVCEYKKSRLFDISLADGTEFKESRTFAAGDGLPKVFDTPFGRVGVKICFEIRFIEDFYKLERAGAEVCMVPANFSVPTGEAHWELLFRARAIDNQFFVVGCSAARDAHLKFKSYGHSMAVSPWGSVLYQAGTDECVEVVDLDISEIKKRRAEIPVVSARK